MFRDGLEEKLVRGLKITYKVAQQEVTLISSISQPYYDPHSSFLCSNVLCLQARASFVASKENIAGPIPDFSPAWCSEHIKAAGLQMQKPRPLEPVSLDGCCRLIACFHFSGTFLDQGHCQRVHGELW